MMALAIVGFLASTPGQAQPIDLSQGGPITVTARDGIEWQQNSQRVIARGDARAVRENVTVTADRLIAYYRPKQEASPAANAALAKAAIPAVAPAKTAAAGPGAPATESGGNEVYRLEAEGNVHIFTATDVAEGDHATYDMDQAVLLLTGRNLVLTRPAEVLTARDSLEYWSKERLAVARGNAVVVTADARRLAADTLAAYTAPPAEPAGGRDKPASGPPARAAAEPSAKDDPLAASGQIEKVEAFGNVSVRTATDTITGDRGVYTPQTGIARLAGTVRITRGQNQLNGAEAEVDMKTGISRLVSSKTSRVQGLIVPNDATSQSKPPEERQDVKPKDVKPKDVKPKDVKQ